MTSIKIRPQNHILIIAMFLLCFMVVQTWGNTYLLISYFLIGMFGLYIYMTVSPKITKNAKRLFLLMLFFWFQEFSSAQEHIVLRFFVYTAEIIIISSLFLYSIKHQKRINRNHFIITLMAFGFLIIVNFVGNIVTYKSITIFLLSMYDSCKYFSLIFYILAIQPSREDFKKLLELMSALVIINTIVAVLQFLGVTELFDIFRGKYKIVTRVGSFRAIGMFPYGIELGNYSSVLFALYYNFSRNIFKEERKKYLIIQIFLVICIIASGTRTAMFNIAVIYILSNIKSIRGWLKTVLVIFIVIIIGSNFIDFKEIISRTKWDISIELPRTYYFKKGIEIWKDHPFFGIGFNTYASSKYRDRTGDIIFDTYDAHGFDYANLATSDSFMSEIIPEFGIFGIMIIVLFGLYIYKQYKKKIVYKDFYSMFLISIVSIGIMAINTSTPFINSHIGSWFWISCGMLMCACPSSVTKEIH